MRYGPPDDPSEAPTGSINYGSYGEEPEPPSAPWYRKPAALIGFGVLAAILIALAIYGIVELTSSSGGSTSTSSTTPTGATTTATTAPVAPAPTTPLTSAPAATPPTSTSIDDGHHHHHHHDDGDGDMP